MKIFKFNDSLKKGASGEARLLSMFPKLIKKDGRKEDFVTPCGKLVELKCESRSISETPNLALELQSRPGKPGAIERAVADSVDYLVYMFACNTLFIYSPKAVLDYMSHNLDRYRTVKIANPSYFTTIVLIPRADVAHLEIEFPNSIIE